MALSIKDKINADAELLDGTDSTAFQTALTFGIANNNAVEIDAADVADNDFARFTANGLEGRSAAEVLSDIGALGLSSLLASMEWQSVINGDFQVWQRGVSAAVADVTQLFLADCWRDYADKNGGTLPTLTRSKGTAEIINGRYQAFSRLATNGAGTSLGVSSYHDYRQRIEYGTRRLCGDGKTITVSFWARSDIANKKIGVLLTQNYGTGGSPSADEIINGANFALTSSWAKYTHTFTTNTLAAKTFGTTDSDYLQLQLRYIWGTTTDAQVGATTAETYVGSGYVDIAEVQVSEGSNALPFVVEDYNTVIAKCRLYCQKLGGAAEATYARIGMGFAVNTQGTNIALFTSPFRKLPTFTWTTSLNLSDGATAHAVTAVLSAATVSTKDMVIVQANIATTSLAQFRPYFLEKSVADATGGILLEAEL